MRKLGRIGIVFGCLLLSLMVLGHHGVWAADEAGGFYIEGGAGPMFFNPPQRDSLPFYETDGFGLANGRVQADLAFETDETALAGHLALGYRAGGETVGILGTNTRVELASTFFSLSDSDTTVAAAPNGVPEGYFLGMYYSDRGMEGVAVLGHGDISGTAQMPQVHQSAGYDFADFNLTVAADYPTVHERLRITPRVGLVYAFFNQDYALSAETPDSLAPAIVGGKFDYSTDERLKSDYAGLSLGLDGRFEFGNGFSLTAGGTFMPLYSHTRMDLDYSGKAWPGVSLDTEVSDSDEEMTYRALGELGLAYRADRLTVALGALIDYWEAVPVVSYPAFQPGEFNALFAMSSRAPEIDYDDMLNVLVMLKIAVAF